jgi:hypothetical protein
MKRSLLAALGAIGLLAVASGGFAFAWSGREAQATDPVAVRSTSVTVPAAKPNRYVKAEFAVSCLPGELAVGGGYRSAGFVWMAGSYPASAGAWTVVLANGRTRSTTATVYAVCLGNGTTPGTTGGTTTGGTTTTAPGTTTTEPGTTTGGGTYTYPY